MNRLGPPQPELQQRYPPRQFTPLTALVSQVLREVQHEKYLRWPSQMRIDPTKRYMTKYCEFHRDHRHQTDDCIQLRKEIKYLIKRGYLRCYLAPEGRDQASPPATLLANSSSAPTTFGRDPCDLKRICWGRGVKLG